MVLMRARARARKPDSGKVTPLLTLCLEAPYRGTILRARSSFGDVISGGMKDDDGEMILPTY